MKIIRYKEVYIISLIYLAIVAGAFVILLFISRDWQTATLAAVYLLVLLVILLPAFCQTIHINNARVKLKLWFLTLRKFTWKQIKEMAVIVSKGNRDEALFIYISKRRTNPEELRNIHKIKDRKNFIYFGIEPEYAKKLLEILPDEFKESLAKSLESLSDEWKEIKGGQP